jgi:hypothetical protein
MCLAERKNNTIIKATGLRFRARFQLKKRGAVPEMGENSQDV